MKLKTLMISPSIVFVKFISVFHFFEQGLNLDLSLLVKLEVSGDTLVILEVSSDIYHKYCGADMDMPFGIGYSPSLPP